MPTRNTVIKTIRQHTDKINAYGVKKIGIFGSYTQAHQNSKSDIDVLVEFDKGSKTFDNYIGLKFYLEGLFHRKVDLVIKEALKKRIKNRVLSEVRYA